MSDSSMNDTPPAPSPSQGGGVTTNDRPMTMTNSNGTPKNDNKRLITIPAKNARFVNVKCVEGNQTFENLNSFIIKKVLDGQVDRSLDFVKKLRNGSLLVKVQFPSQVDDLLKLTQIHDRKVKVSIPVGLNTCKGAIFHRDFRMMDESEILEAMKDQSVVDVHCMTKGEG